MNLFISGFAFGAAAVMVGMNLGSEKQSWLPVIACVFIGIVTLL